MSYILEALKKSDQKRKLGNVPDLHADHAEIKSNRVKQGRRFWLFLFFGFVVLVNALVWLIFRGPWQHGDEIIVVENSIVESTESPAAKVVSEPPALVGVIPARPIAPPTVEKPAEPLRESIEEAEPETSAVPSHEPLTIIPEPDIEVMALNNLPDRVQEKLPEINISLHFFSKKPSSRLVRINDKHLGEGDYLRDDLRLIEITRNGVVLEFEGYRFLKVK